ncbi:NAD(P)-dependent oxidoreductase [Magnetospirillum sp. UT-4]|uniref:NAD-dependent epimerase/dehydratase family protein n=1 Tax=Magnetospirillum sp. UT-4 TaxID=2681467 RepID=UPI00137F1CA1|nr:NAD-dependent epimerase/dehydratase family protein [Magnetospirillum sp. UT-4]CAA7621828.1 NAD-dependent epimerase/dehydratase [Magnetospirillum sp. UT-4]
MKIFISGVAGFLGSHIADAMIAEGHQVIGCDSMIGGLLDNVPSTVEFHQVDCNQFDTMLRLTKGCDVVYHCAATAYEGLSVFSPHLVTQNIFSASVSLFAAAIQNRVRRIVFCSSMARYGTNAVPFREDYPTRPQDPYGIAKVAAEDVLRNLCQVHGVEFTIAVPHNIIGPRQKYDDPYRNVAAIMMNLMLQNRQPIIYGDGQQKRCFSFVDDCVFCLKEMAFSNKVLGEVINIGPDEEFVSVLQLAETIANQLRFNLDPIFMPDRPQEVKLATCSADKARQLLGYRTSISLRDGLQQMIDYIKTRGTLPFKYHLDLEIINDITPKTWSERLF